ncbi:MAG TPA: cupin domain-containing protein [Mucilaginibacter sp.]
MKQLQVTDHYKVVKVEFAAGHSMPRHTATSDAFLIVESGKALLIFEKETVELSQGITQPIPANEEHMLKIVDDFKAYIIMANESKINFSKPGQQKLN